jgi:hypothetical protein
LPRRAGIVWSGSLPFDDIDAHLVEFPEYVFASSRSERTYNG